jgi:hypothetical protein
VDATRALLAEADIKYQSGTHLLCEHANIFDRPNWRRLMDKGRLDRGFRDYIQLALRNKAAKLHPDRVGDVKS